MADVSEKVLDTAKEWLVQKSKTWEGGVTRGCVMDLKGNITHGNGFSACHSWVSDADRAYSGHVKDNRNYLLLTCHSKRRSKKICSEQAHEAIILWLASDECPLSEFILNRDDKDSLLNGGLIILCGPDGIVNHNHALWLCKVLRYGIEGSQALDVWHELYSNGVNPLLALFVATYVRSVKGATFGFSGAEGHSAVFSGGYWGSYKIGAHAEDLLDGVLNKSATNTTEVFMRENRRATNDSPNKDREKIKKFCAPLQKSDGWGGTVAAAGADKSEFVSRVLQWEAEMLAKKVMLAQKVKEKIKNILPNENTVYLEVDI